MTHNPEVLFGGTRPMLELIDQIYACAPDPALWPAVLERISDFLGGESLALFARFPESVILAKTRITDDAWQNFAEYYAALNPIAPRCDLAFGDSQARYSQAVITDSELLGTEFYNDFFLPNRMHHAIGVSVSVGEGLPLADFSCQRPRNDGEFGSNAGTILEVLAPHLQRSLMMSQTMKQLTDTANGLDAALSRHDHVVFGLGPDAQVVFQSSAAERMLSAESVLQVQNGRLRLPQPDDDERLQALLGGVTEMTVGGAAGGAMQVHPPTGQPVDVLVEPFRQNDVLGFPRIVAIVTISDPSQTPLSRGAVMRSLFRLTPVEVRMADLLLAGKDTREAAEALRISFETSRFHVKRVLAKTGTKRQTDLVRRMMGLPGA